MIGCPEIVETDRVRLGRAIYKPGIGEQLHWHPIEACYYVISGHATVRNIEGKEFEVGPGLHDLRTRIGIAGAHEWEVKESLELLDIRATNETQSQDPRARWTLRPSGRISTSKISPIARRSASSRTTKAEIPMFRPSRVACGMLAIALCTLAAGAAAQAYPAKAIRMIMPFPPGGPTDIVGRLVAAKVSEQIGQSVVADSRPGASGNVGLEIASKSPPDGYTIVLSSPVIALSPLLYGKLNYDPWKDLAPIALVGAVRNVFVIHPSVPAKTLKEFIEIARKSPGKLNYGSGGIGTTTHLAPELLKSLKNSISCMCRTKAQGSH